MDGKVTCKVQCVEKGMTAYGTKAAKLVFQPVSSGSEENKKFFQYTPSGRIELGVVNEEAAKQFEAGEYYYVDFRPAEK